jgi:hypothetical protein
MIDYACADSSIDVSNIVGVSLVGQKSEKLLIARPLTLYLRMRAVWECVCLMFVAAISQQTSVVIAICERDDRISSLKWQFLQSNYIRY